MHQKVVPVFQVIGLVRDFVIERKITVGPRKSASDTGRHADRTEVFGTFLREIVSIGFIRIIEADGQRIGLAAAEPRLGEVQRDRFIISTVGLSLDRQLLVLSRRIGTPFVAFKQVADREVVQLDADRTDEHTGTPTARNLEFVARLLFQRERKVDQFVGYGNDIGLQLLRIEVLHLAQLAQRGHQHRTVVQFAGANIQFTANHFVVHPVVTRKVHIVDPRLLTFVHFDDQIHGIFPDDHLLGFDLREEVARILVKRRNGHLLRIRLPADTQLFMQRLAVIGSTLDHPQHVVECFGVIHAVTEPRDIPVVEFTSFVHRQRNPDTLIVDRIDRILDDDRIAVAARIVVIEQVFLILFVLLALEFRSPENINTLLVGLFEGLAQAFVGKDLISLETDLADLDAALLVYDKSNVDGIVHRGIVDLLDGNFRILEAFFVEIFLDRVTVGIDHELRKFATPLQLKFFVDQLGLFAFVHTHDIPFEYTGALLQVNFEIDAVTHRLGQNPYIGKIPLAPHFTHRRGDVVAREHDRIAFVQPRGVRDNLGIEELDTGDGHLVHDIAFRGIVVGYRCIGHPCLFCRIDGCCRALRHGGRPRAHSYRQEHQGPQSFSHMPFGNLQTYSVSSPYLR